jgi:hypothetical protein
MLDFLGIGAQKCGTSWLYERLAQHPAVEFPAGKELHFWNAHRDRGVEWYRSLFEKNAPGRKKGEITPAYAMLTPSVIREIRDLYPALRAIYVIRNPIERAWSAALMALGRAEMSVEEASDQWFTDHFRSSGSLARGDYETCLRNWWSVFGREAVLVMRYEVLCEDPLGFLETCCRHIGVEPAFFRAMPPEAVASRVFEGPDTPIRESLLGVLREIYRPRVQSLESAFGWDLASWRKT